VEPDKLLLHDGKGCFEFEPFTDGRFWGSHGESLPRCRSRWICIDSDRKNWGLVYVDITHTLWRSDLNVTVMSISSATDLLPPQAPFVMNIVKRESPFVFTVSVQNTQRIREKMTITGGRLPQSKEVVCAGTYPFAALRADYLRRRRRFPLQLRSCIKHE
jgi:hypothetical protein